jgi:hypothetical protein
MLSVRHRWQTSLVLFASWRGHSTVRDRRARRSCSAHQTLTASSAPQGWTSACSAPSCGRRRTVRSCRGIACMVLHACACALR